VNLRIFIFPFLFFYLQQQLPAAVNYKL